jgi:ABC-type dipeptide/oligopeptide/nickel transport system permease subunit
MSAPAAARDNPFTRSVAGVIGIVFLSLMVLACIATLPWTLGAPAPAAGASAVPRYNAGDPTQGRLPPFWWRAPAPAPAAEETPAADAPATDSPADTPRFLLGTDVLGRSLFIRCLTGGGISLGIGIAAAFISVVIGTLYGGLSGYIGGKTDALLMRIVDVLYGLPYILLVVLLAVASEAVVEDLITRAGARERWSERTIAPLAPSGHDARDAWLSAPIEPADPLLDRLHRRLASSSRAAEHDPAALLAPLLESGASRRAALDAAALAARPPRELSDSTRTLIDVGTLLIAIGGVSWLTMARVIRGQVLSLKGQQFVEAARATGVPPARIFARHLLPNLLGPIIVYATLTVPQAILQESFLSFLGIGVKPPLPSWGNLAAEGLSELNTYRSNWWLLLFPCLLLGLTLLALNFVGEGLREAFDPKRARR